jgi:basic membrane lipoprotein Med (substrate-binding protein (PBP1-ABC) superfamily)
MGYGMEVHQFGATCALLSTTWLWGPHFIHVFEEVLAGTWAGNRTFYGGFGAGMVGLEGWGEQVPPAIKNKALQLADELAKKEVAARAAGLDITTAEGIFCGPIKDQNGQTIIAEGSCWTDEDVLSRQVLVYGVKGQVSE